MRVWELNIAQRKIRASDVQTGQIKRIIKCITIDQDDEFMYCGTTTGDLLQVSLKTKLFKNSGPKAKVLRFDFRNFSVWEFYRQPYLQSVIQLL